MKAFCHRLISKGWACFGLARMGGAALALVAAEVVGSGVECRAQDFSGATLSFGFSNTFTGDSLFFGGSGATFFAANFALVDFSSTLNIGNGTVGIGNIDQNVYPNGNMTQPTDQAVAAGTNATFTVQFIPSGETLLTQNEPVAYQWEISTDNGSTWANLTDSATISGNATNTLVVSNTTLAMSGQMFRVEVTPQGASFPDLSVNVTLTVGDTLPNIDTPPASQAQDAGNTTSFTVTADSTLPLTYQWLKNGSAIDGATAATLTLTNVQTADGGNYSVTVTNAVGNVTTDAAVLTVVNLPPSIDSAPVAENLAAGSKAIFAVTANSTLPVTYQWLKNGDAISGATGATLTIKNVGTANAGNYSVTVTNSVGNVTSVPSALTVYFTAPNIVTQPVATTIERGNAVSFTVVASNALPMTYQWQRNGVNLRNVGAVSGALKPKLSISRVTLANVGTYRVRVSDSVGQVASAAVTLTVK